MNANAFILDNYGLEPRDNARPTSIGLLAIYTAQRWLEYQARSHCEIGGMGK